MTLIEIDGSQGEGGGQILRTSLGLSMVTGRGFRISNIRAGRRQPGLLRQHLAAVRAAAAIGQAEVTGDELGSASLTFLPGRAKPGEYTFSIGTAGSTTLVLQTVLPALLTANRSSRLVLEGGTHNMQAPPYDFVAKAFVPLINRIGPQVTVHLERYGFYPAGGGQFIVEINPVPALAPLMLEERGEIVARRARAIVANLKRHIGQREVDTAAELMNWPSESRCVQMTRDSAGPGNVLMLEIESAGGITEVFSGFGRIGALAEAVALEAVEEAREYLVAGAAVGEHLADQLLVPLALAGGGSFTTSKLTLHARTNIETIQRFLPVEVETRRTEDRGWLVELHS